MARSGVSPHLVALILPLFLVASPHVGQAQPTAGTARIGYLSALSAAADAPHRDAFRQGLLSLGYVEG